jgi:hypothetical protein
VTAPLLPPPCGTGTCRGQADPIKSIGKFFGASSPDAKHSEVSTDNAGEAGAVIVAAPAAHAGKIYHISSAVFTNNEVRVWCPDARTCS